MANIETSEEDTCPPTRWVTAPPVVIDVPVARRVLGDCHFALRLIEEEQPTGQRWRIHWVALLAHLRTVGEVLRNVDLNSAAVHPAVKEEIRAFRESLKAEDPGTQIYWQFIRDDANDILHRHRFHAKQVSIYVTDRGQVERATTSAAAADDGVLLFDPGEPRERLYLMKGGPFAEKDQREVVRKAIEWWQVQLDAIVAKAKARAA